MSLQMTSALPPSFGGTTATDTNNEFETETISPNDWTLYDKIMYGGFGYSMIIKGLDKGVNDNVESRKIIFHSTEKMSNPWSNGCFATPSDINKKIIDLYRREIAEET